MKQFCLAFWMIYHLGCLYSASDRVRIFLQVDVLCRSWNCNAFWFWVFEEKLKYAHWTYENFVRIRLLADCAQCWSTLNQTIIWRSIWTHWYFVIIFLHGYSNFVPNIDFSSVTRLLLHLTSPYSSFTWRFCRNIWCSSDYYHVPVKP